MSRTLGTGAAYVAVCNALKAILGPGAGYAYSLGARVFDAEIDPDDVPGTELPFATCTLFEDDGTYPEVEGSWAKVNLRLDIKAFVPATESTDVETGNSVAVANMHDDILKALMPTGLVPRWNAGSPAIKTMTPIARRLIPADREIKFGIVLLTVDVTIQVDRNDLTA